MAFISYDLAVLYMYFIYQETTKKMVLTVHKAEAVLQVYQLWFTPLYGLCEVRYQTCYHLFVLTWAMPLLILERNIFLSWSKHSFYNISCVVLLNRCATSTSLRNEWYCTAGNIRGFFILLICDFCWTAKSIYRKYVQYSYIVCTLMNFFGDSANLGHH